MYDKVLEKLKKYNQEHLLEFYNELNEEEKKDLLSQISKIDFEYIERLYAARDKYEMMDKEISNVAATDKSK